MSEGRFGGILVTPATLLMVVFLGLPLLYGITVSFQLYDLRSAARGSWIGLGNYEALLQ